jgi:hypothetical protein
MQTEKNPLKFFKKPTGMTEEFVERIYIQVYFWSLLIVQTLMIISSPEPGTAKGMANALFFYLSLVPLYGYAYHKKTASQLLWKLFLLAFFIWEAACFFYLYEHELTVNAMLLIMLCPLYWSMVNYVLVTMEADESKRATMTDRVKKVKKKFRTVIVICSAMAQLLLVLCFFILIKNL